MDQLRVLLVDDETGFQAIYADWLREQGVIFDLERTVEAAIDRLRKFNYDIAFIDYHVGREFGTRVIKETAVLTLITGKPCFIAITGDARPETLSAIYEAGFSKVLLKPFRHSEFMDILQDEMLYKLTSPKEQ